MTGAFLYVAASAGLLSLLTPCVFPMVPLTVSYFSAGTRDRGDIMRRAAAFGVAMILSFTGLGVMVAAMFGAAGVSRLAANPWLNLAIAAALLLFAANLFGYAEVALPAGLLNRFRAPSEAGQSRTGSYLLGAMFALTSFSCTAPFVGTLLVASAGGDLTMPIAGMLVYSTSFATPSPPRWAAPA